MNFSELIRYVIITLIAFFVASPVIMSTIGRFGVQRRFAIHMVNEGIITEETFKSTQKTQQIVSIAFSILVIGVLVSMGIMNGLYAWICILGGLIVGALRFRGAVIYSSQTVQSFKKVYVDKYDIEKLNKFVEENF